MVLKNSNTDKDVTWGGAGHTIKDTDGNNKTQRTNLQFTGLDVTDDSTNNITEVSGIGLNNDSIDDIANGDISAGYVQSDKNYSTEEQIIGKWVNGKPIYQKTYITTTPSTALSNDDVATLGISIDQLVSLEGVVTRTQNGSIYRYPINCLIGSASDYSADIRACWLRPTTIAMKVGQYDVNQPVAITIKYTKTTD